MCLAKACPGWDSTCNQRVSFSWGKTQRWIFAGHSWVWQGDMEIHILQLLQGLSQVGEDTKALKQQHRGKLHIENYFYKKLNQFCSFLLGSWAQALSTLIVLHLQPMCCTHTAVQKCPGTDTNSFHCSRFQVFQHVAFSFLRSIRGNSAGLLLQQPSC